jgi:hypothetical protein
VIDVSATLVATMQRRAPSGPERNTLSCSSGGSDAYSGSTSRSAAEPSGRAQTAALMAFTAFSISAWPVRNTRMSPVGEGPGGRVQGVRKVREVAGRGSILSSTAASQGNTRPGGEPAARPNIQGCDVIGPAAKPIIPAALQPASRRLTRRLARVYLHHSVHRGGDVVGGVVLARVDDVDREAAAGDVEDLQSNGMGAGRGCGWYEQKQSLASHAWWKVAETLSSCCLLEAQCWVAARLLRAPHYNGRGKDRDHGGRGPSGAHRAVPKVG